MRFKAMVAVGLVLVAAACAPKAPDPILPEPVYDKYGNAVVDTPQCRDGRQSYADNTAASRLPICENSCQEGYGRTADFQQCVPDDQNGGRDSGGQQPTTGTKD